MGLLPRVGGVPGPVQVQDHPVRARPVGHRLHRGIADGEVDHDDDAAELFGELGALVHILHGGRGHVQVMALDLAGLPPARFTASMPNRNRSRQRMNGWELMFSSSLVKSSPPRSAS